MAKPIALIKINRLITLEELAKVEEKLAKHSVSVDYHILIVTCLDITDVQIEMYNDSEATETSVTGIKQQIKALINKSYKDT